MRRRRFLAAGLAAVTAGCGGNGGGDGDDYDVGMTASAFRPAEIEISTGETVRWKNTSAGTHTVTAYEESLPAGAEYFASGGFESQSAAEEGWREMEGGIASDGVYEHTFDVAGTYRYFCVPHEAIGMKGKVVVSD